MHSHGLKKCIRPIVSRTEQMRISPHFRIKRTTTSVKYTHNQPTHIAEVNGISERQTDVRLVSIFPPNDFVEARLKHPPFNDFNFIANLQNVFRNAAYLDIR